MTLDKATVIVKISQAHKEKFLKIKESENITQVKLIEKLIDIYDDYQELKTKSAQIQYEELDYNEIGLEVVDNQDASLQENEIEIVAQASKNINFSWQQIVKDSLLQLAKDLNGIGKNQPNLDSMSDEQLKHQKFSGVPEDRISNAIEAIQNHNDRQSEKSDKYCITKGIASIWVPGICC